MQIVQVRAKMIDDHRTAVHLIADAKFFRVDSHANLVSSHFPHLDLTFRQFCLTWLFGSLVESFVSNFAPHLAVEDGSAA
jgi:hypothetical protein